MERSFASSVAACLLAALVALATFAISPATAAGLRISELPAGAPTDVATITSGRSDSAFVDHAGPIVTASPAGDLWYRITLDADWHAADPPVLSIEDAGFTRVRLYSPPDYAERALWMEKPDPVKRLSRHALAFLLPADLRANQPIYLLVERTLIKKHPRIALTDLAHYEAADLDHVRIVTLFESVQFAMILVGFCLWLALRDRVFLYFIAYAGTQLIYLLMMVGEFYDLPGGIRLSMLGQMTSWFFATVSAAFSISFVLEFCDLRRNTPRLAKVFGATRWVYVILLPALLLPAAFKAPLQDTLNLILLLSSLVAIVAVSLSTWQGNRASRFFLVAWMPQVAFLVVRATQLLMVAPMPTWLEYGFPFTMAFSSIIITLGLADATLHARRERDIAHGLAERDGLTGVLNRRALTARLANALVDARAHARSLALLFLDIDHFKVINDRHGHLVGDACLIALAETLGRALKDGQTFGRYGGEEFLVILPGATRTEAMLAGESLRRQIESMEIEPEGIPLRMTASIGIAQLLGHDDTVDHLVDRADQALYRAKAAGRNRVTMYEPASVTTGF